MKLKQQQYISGLRFLADHFSYGASSKLKEMLETEVTELGKQDAPVLRAREDPNRKYSVISSCVCLNHLVYSVEYLDSRIRNKILLLPTYMVSVACERLDISMIDAQGRDVLHTHMESMETVLEKHKDRNVIIGRLGDLRVRDLLVF